MKFRTVVLGVVWLATGCDDTEISAHTEVAYATLAGNNPFAEVSQPNPAEREFAGRVQEVLRAGSYTYLRIATLSRGERWVVTTRRELAVGGWVSVKNMGIRRGFRSKRLGRSFDELVFGVVRPAPREEEKRPG